MRGGHPKKRPSDSGSAKARVANRRFFDRRFGSRRDCDCPYGKCGKRRRKNGRLRFPPRKHSSRNARRQLSTRNERGTRATAFALHVARHADDRHRHAHARIGRGALREAHRLRSKRCGTRTRVAFDASIAYRGETHPPERAFASPHAHRTRVARWEGTSTPTPRWGSRARPPGTR